MEHVVPVISVVVPTLRGAHRLPILLAALEGQDLEEPWELIVVVDGRDAATEAVLEAHRERLPLRIIVRDRAGGVAVALNAGYAASTARVVVRCDDDLRPAPDMLRQHLGHHQGPDPVGVIGPTRDVLPDSAYARAYGRPTAERALAAAYARPPSLRWLGWAAHNSLTRATWEAVGRFDESYAYREDTDLGIRLAEHGVRLVVDPALELEHRGAATDTAMRASRAWVSGASEVLFAARHPQAAPSLATPATGIRGRVWSAATTALAGAMRGRVAAARVGGVVDRALPHLSPASGGRAVALVVEAAARSGRRRGAIDQRAYRTQKDAELAAEGRAQR